MTIPIAIVGCGLIGRKRARAFNHSGLAQVVALYDVDRSRAVAMQQELGPGCRVVNSTHEAAGVVAGGLTVVSTVHESLARESCVALNAGSNVLVEKPGGTTAAEVRSIRDAAESAALVARFGYNHRFHPSFQKLRAMLADRPFGEIMMVRGRYGHGGRPGYEREWRASKALSGGGELLDQGVHLLDLTRAIAGNLSLLYAAFSTLYWTMDVEDNAFVHARLPFGGDAWLHASWTEWKNLFDFEVYCQTAKLQVTGLGGSYGPERLTVYEMPPELGPPLTTVTEWPPGDTSWVAEAIDVVNAIQGLSCVGASIDDALATLTIVDEAYSR